MAGIDEKVLGTDDRCIWQYFLKKDESTTGKEMAINLKEGSAAYVCSECRTPDPLCSAYVPLSRLAKYKTEND